MTGILVTGANGFVGRRLCMELERQGNRVLRAVRVAQSSDSAVGAVEVGPIDAATEWRPALAGIRAIIHLAARVHVMREGAADSAGEYRRVNVEGTLNLARQAAETGVRRLVFISSVKVNGESTLAGRPFLPDDVPAPVDEYGNSKLEAELALRDLAQRTGLEVVTIRPVLVYGPGVRANFLSLLRCVYRGIPLPLGAISNRRSLLALDNFVDLIAICLQHAAAANQTFMASDGEDLSTTQLIRKIGESFCKPARLFPVPPALLMAGASLIGKQAALKRLCGSLQVDNSKARVLLGWSPPISVDEGIRRTILEFLSAQSE